jgi:hypothetical protein
MPGSYNADSGWVQTYHISGHTAKQLLVKCQNYGKLDQLRNADHVPGARAGQNVVKEPTMGADIQATGAQVSAQGPLCQYNQHLRVSRVHKLVTEKHKLPLAFDEKDRAVRGSLIVVSKFSPELRFEELNRTGPQFPVPVRLFAVAGHFGLEFADPL